MSGQTGSLPRVGVHFWQLAVDAVAALIEYAVENGNGPARRKNSPTFSPVNGESSRPLTGHGRRITGGLSDIVVDINMGADCERVLDSDTEDEVSCRWDGQFCCTIKVRAIVVRKRTLGQISSWYIIEVCVVELGCPIFCCCSDFFVYKGGNIRYSMGIRDWFGRQTPILTTFTFSAQVPIWSCTQMNGVYW